jgi:hypothetical protein
MYQPTAVREKSLPTSSKKIPTPLKKRVRETVLPKNGSRPILEMDETTKFF